jgi:hypothetical protein
MAQADSLFSRWKASKKPSAPTRKAAPPAKPTPSRTTTRSTPQQYKPTASSRTVTRSTPRQYNQPQPDRNPMIQQPTPTRAPQPQQWPEWMKTVAQNYVLPAIRNTFNPTGALGGPLMNQWNVAPVVPSGMSQRAQDAWGKRYAAGATNMLAQSDPWRAYRDRLNAQYEKYRFDRSWQAAADRLAAQAADYNSRPVAPIEDQPGSYYDPYGGGWGGWGGGGGGGGGGGQPAANFWNQFLNWRVLEVQGG